MPTQKRLRELFTYDAERGILIGKQCSLCGSHDVPVHSYHNEGYLTIRADGKNLLMHRVIWVYFHKNIDPKIFIDHIDGNRANNKLENLRIVDKRGNCKNAARRSDNTSGCTGVHWSKNDQRWIATIKVGGQIKRLGAFKIKEDAIVARKTAEPLYGYHENHGRNAIISHRVPAQRRRQNGNAIYSV